EKDFAGAPAAALPLLVSGRAEDAGKGALFIHQDAAVYGGMLQAGAEAVLPVKHQAYLLVSKGAVQVEGEHLAEGDGAEITDIATLRIQAPDGAELLVMDVPE